MIELTSLAAREALDRAYQEERCPSCARAVATFGSFVLQEGGVWFFCHHCIDTEVLAMVLPLKGDPWHRNGHAD